MAFTRGAGVPARSGPREIGNLPVLRLEQAVFGIDFSRNQKLALWALVGISAIGLSYRGARDSFTGSSGDVVLTEPSNGNTGVVASDSDPMPDLQTSHPSKVIFQVAGCVNRPGVYQLPYGERVVKAVATAGGAKPNADLQSINLAAKIEDGSRIYIPSLDETRNGASGGRVSAASTAHAERASGTKGSASSNKLSMLGEGTVNINSGGPDDLQRLPGVGPATAEKILEYRRQIGRFTSVEQLMDVKGIGPKKLDKMRPFVSL